MVKCRKILKPFSLDSSNILAHIKGVDIRFCRARVLIYLTVSANNDHSVFSLRLWSVNHANFSSLLSCVNMLDAGVV